MARNGKANGSAGEGHNSKGELSQADKNALLVHHMSILRARQKDVDEARAPLKAAQEEFTAAVNAAKTELGKRFTRKRLVNLLQDATARLRDILREEEERFQDRIAMGLPVYGEQQDLFATDKLPEEARDELHYEAEGYLFGRRAADPSPPEGTPPRFFDAFMRGYHRGQEENGRLLAAAGEASRAKAQANGKLTEEEPEAEEDDEATIAKKARALKKAGWTDPTPEEAAFEPVH